MQQSGEANSLQDQSSSVPKQTRNHTLTGTDHAPWAGKIFCTSQDRTCLLRRKKVAPIPKNTIPRSAKKMQNWISCSPWQIWSWLTRPAWRPESVSLRQSLRGQTVLLVVIHRQGGLLHSLCDGVLTYLRIFPKIDRNFAMGFASELSIAHSFLLSHALAAYDKHPIIICFFHST